MRPFEQTKKGQDVLKNQDDKGLGKRKPKSGGSASKEPGDDSEEDTGGDMSAEGSDGAAAVEEGPRISRPTGPRPFQPKTKKKPEATASDTKKDKKTARVWDYNSKVSTHVMNSLDHSRTKDDKDGGADDDEEALRRKMAEYLPDPEEMSSETDVESLPSEESDGEAEIGKETRAGGLFKKLTTSVKNITGGAVLTKEELEPILKKFKIELMSRNVAAEAADQLALSVQTTLFGKKTERFTSMTATVKGAIMEAMETLLTPKKSIDVLRAALAAKSAGRVYTIVFLGVNGVGKSTNLAKVAYYLKHKGNLNVLICACDTFRAGAVEQLKTHSRCLDVPLFERGYGKDPAEIAKQAIDHAKKEVHDVVLVDTAGRMQDNEPLMRALAKLVAVNSPDLVLFVGEALVGNDAIDQVRKFNRALIDMSHDRRNPRGIDGMLLTKYDTVDDKVGAALSMVYETKQPIIFV